MLNQKVLGIPLMGEYLRNDEASQSTKGNSMVTDDQLRDLGISLIKSRRKRSPEATRVMKEVERCIKMSKVKPKRKPNRK